MSRVKICGLRRIEDICAVNRALPDYIGFVFAESRRQVDEETAVILKSKLDERIKAVGVFVNQDIAYIAGLCQDGIVDVIQLHGGEDGEYLRRLRQCCDRPVIIAVNVGKSLPDIPVDADYLLFDTASINRGGTGKAFDWSLIRKYQGLPYFLAGGLDSSNVSGAVSLLRPYCVDVSSGVETGGVKDSVKINEFVQTVRRFG